VTLAGRSITRWAIAAGMLLAFCAQAQEPEPAAVPAEPAKPAAEDAAAELARKLANPIAALISVPVKYSWDTGIGSTGGERATTVVQPVIPFTLNDDWTLVTRTIIPYVDQSIPGAPSGLGDITQSFFFSPSRPTASGWIWGAGPVFGYPSASDDLLGTGKWSAGPTLVVLKQQHGWTYGVLANHLWSFGGDDDRADVSTSFVQPFLSFTTARFTTFGVNTETSYDWESDQATVPVNLSASQLFKVGGQPMSLALAYRHFFDTPPGGPDWGLSLTYTLLFPK
jgi:hypothetical protein